MTATFIQQCPGLCLYSPSQNTEAMMRYWVASVAAAALLTLSGTAQAQMGDGDFRCDEICLGATLAWTGALFLIIGYTASGDAPELAGAREEDSAPPLPVQVDLTPDTAGALFRLEW